MPITNTNITKEQQALIVEHYLALIQDMSTNDLFEYFTNNMSEEEKLFVYNEVLIEN